MDFTTDWEFDDLLNQRFKEGLKKGREEGKKEAARNALAKGVSPELVTEITGLDAETVKSLEARR